MNTQQYSERRSETRFYSVLINYGQFQGYSSSQEPMMSLFPLNDEDVWGPWHCWPFPATSENLLKVRSEESYLFWGKHLSQPTSRFQQTYGHHVWQFELALPVVNFTEEVSVVEHSEISVAEGPKKDWLEFAKKGVHLNKQVIWGKSPMEREDCSMWMLTEINNREAFYGRTFSQLSLLVEIQSCFWSGLSGTGLLNAFSVGVATWN